MAVRLEVIFSALVALALSACDIVTGPAVPSSGPAENCAANASAPWRPLSGVEFQLTAVSEGADCANANATLTVSDAAGQTLYTEMFPASQVMVLAHADTAQAMQQALADWIDTSRSNLRAASELPVWAPDADTPVSGEFPFYPEAALDRAAYAALRARDAPLLCFVQGMESMACLALDGGALTKVGLQSFPG